jgi:hypothetical protein
MCISAIIVPDTKATKFSVLSMASVLSQKFGDEVSPDASGRKKVAHGVSRG